MSSDIPTPTSPIRVRNSKRSTLPISLSNTTIVPDVGKDLVARILSRVDLPAPFGPKITQRSPGDIANVTGPRIVRGPRVTLTSDTRKTSGRLTGQKIVRIISDYL
jgi:hypothetical protein